MKYITFDLSKFITSTIECSVLFSVYYFFGFNISVLIGICLILNKFNNNTK